MSKIFIVWYDRENIDKVFLRLEDAEAYAKSRNPKYPLEITEEIVHE